MRCALPLQEAVGMPIPNTARPLWKNLLAISVPVVMSIVALNQQRLAHTGPLNPWKGGGFGMFSNPESPPINRAFSASGITWDGQQVEIALPYGKQWTRLRNNPTDDSMTATINQMATVKLTKIRRRWLSKEGPLFPRASRVLLSRGELFDKIGLYTLTNPPQDTEGPAYRQLTLNLWNLHAHLEEARTVIGYELIFSKTVAFERRDEGNLATSND